MVSAGEALNHGQIDVSSERIVNITIIQNGGELNLMSENTNNNTNITGNTNSSIVNASQQSYATTNIQQTHNQPIDMAMVDLIKLINSHMAVETAKAVEPLVNQATEEAKKPDKDSSRIRGILGVLEPLLKVALLLPEGIEAFDKWKHLLGV